MKSASALKTNLAKIDSSYWERVGERIAGSSLGELVVANASGGTDLTEYTADRRVIDLAAVKSRNQARAWLEGENVEPLACVPTDFWNSLCRRSGLVVLRPTRLDPDGRGAILVKMSKLSELEGVTALYYSRNWATALPDVEATAADVRRAGDSLSEIEFTLPEPPLAERKVLENARRLGIKLRVAAVADAIALSESPLEVAKRTERERQEREEAARRAAEAEQRRRMAIARDPIIFFERDRLIIIIARWGEFPVEEMVLKEALESAV